MERATGRDGVTEPTRVFVSYARKDSRAIDALVPVLQQQGYDVLVDRKDIAAAEVWRPRIEQLILDSDAVVFVVSPQAVRSDVCAWEVERTLAYGKKLVPLVWQNIDPKACPPEIAERNWIFWPRLFAGAPGAKTVEALRSAIDRDISWERERTVWIGRAVRWDKASRPEGQLLRREEVASAEAWAARRPTAAAALPEVLLAYFAASRERERRDRDHLRSITGRAFVLPIANAIRDHEPDRALRMLATAAVLAEDPSFELVPQLWIEGARALMQQPLCAVGDPSAPAMPDPDGEDTVFGVAADTLSAVCQEVSGTVRLFDLMTGAARWATALDFRVRAFVFDGDIIAIGKAGEVLRLNIADGAVVARDSFASRVDVVRAIAEEHAILVSTGVMIQRFDTISNSVTIVGDYDGEVVDIAYCAATGRGLALVVPREGNWVAVAFGVDAGEVHALDDDVRHFCFSKDGSRVCLAERQNAEIYIVGGDAKTVRVRHDGKSTATGDDLCSVALSDDGTLLLTTANDGTARVWETATGTELHRFDHVDEALILQGEFGPDAKTVMALGTDCTVRVWSLASGQEIMRVANRLKPRTTGWDALGFDRAGLSEDGKRLWTVIPGGLLQVWAVKALVEHPVSATVHSLQERVASVQCLREGRVAVRRVNGTVELFDGARVIAERRFVEAVVGLTIFEDADLIAGWTWQKCYLLGLDKERPVIASQHRARPHAAAYVPTGDAVAIGGGNYAAEGFIELARGGEVLSRCRMPGWVSAMSYHPARGALLAGDVNGNFLVWSGDPRAEPVWWAPFDSKVEALAAPPSGHHFYAVVDLTVWRVDADDRRTKIVRLSSSTREAVCDASDRILFVDTLIGPQFIDLERGAVLFELTNHLDPQHDSFFRQCALAQDWQRLFIVTQGGELLTYELDGLLALRASPREAIASALGRGNDIARASERVDLLMSDRPADLPARLRQFSLS